MRNPFVIDEPTVISFSGGFYRLTMGYLMRLLSALLILGKKKKLP